MVTDAAGNTVTCSFDVTVEDNELPTVVCEDLIVYLDEKLEVISPVKGYQTPVQIELYLKMFASDDYKELTTQEAFNEYYLAFKGEFKG